MLKRVFVLSDQGVKDLAEEIITTACTNLIQIIPASLLLMVVMILLEKTTRTQINVGRNIPSSVGITLVLFGTTTIAQLVQYSLTYTAAYRGSANRRIVLAEKLGKLPLSFFEKKNLADLTTTIMGDYIALERTFSNAIPQLLGTILMLVIMPAGLAVLDWRMALCIIIPVPVASIVVVLAHKAQDKTKLENLEAKGCAYDAVWEYIDTIKELKTYSKTNVYLDELDKKLEDVIHCSSRNELAPGISTTAAQFILRSGLVAVLLIGGSLVIRGTLSIPMLILFLLFAGRIYSPFTDCFILLAKVFAALVSIGRVKRVGNTQEQTGSDCYNSIGCDVEFKDVYFSCNEEPVLAGVPFITKQGKIAALVGPSDSGKSTASKLAARFWDTDSGLITLGGIDVKAAEPEVLLKNYAIVFQNVTLFDESVMENIRLDCSGTSDEDVRAITRTTQCDELIDRLPQGRDTNVGESGSKLSDDERQRISIARALLKNTPVILLDEATASMDAKSETMVWTALSALLKGRTVIAITHRMKTIANVDEIVALDKGKVTEVGIPSELAKKGGLYAHLAALQQKQQMSSLPTWASWEGNMKKKQQAITSDEDYLGVILMLQMQKGTMRSVDVARYMEVSKPSMSHAVATLRNGGFPTTDSGYFLRLTDIGRKVAEQIYKKHRLSTERLIAVGMDPKTAEVGARRIEHVVSDENFQKLKKQLM